jgi:type I restriction enzyme S subunit
MIRQKFLENFDRFADAPHALAKMRKLILQLALKGALVRNSPDEIAVPYDSIENARPINATEIPLNWRVVLLSDAIKNRSGNSKLIKGKLHEEPSVGRFQGYSASGADVWCDEYEHEGDAIIISAVGARCGKAFKASGKWSAIANTNITRPVPALLDFEFAYLILNNESFWIRGGSAQPFVKFPPSLERFFAVPPLAEQKRIVTKVDELMALCDQLELQLMVRDSQACSLARASLARFAESPSPANLDLLFHKSFDITAADLRKSILTLAVRGKLIPQDPKDGEARDLIDRAVKNRRQTIQSKNLRRKTLDESRELMSDEAVPNSWCVERLANLVDPENTISYGVLVPGSDVASGIPFVRVQDLSISSPAELPNKTIAPEIEKPYGRTRLRGGEILLCVVGATIGRLGVAPASWAGANIARAVVRIAPIAEIDRDYILVVLRSPLIQSYFATSTRTLAQPTLNVGAIEQTPIPLPPLAEQRRIVAKVDQLMTLVDSLETQIAASRVVSTALLDAVIDKLTSGDAYYALEV